MEFYENRLSGDSTGSIGTSAPAPNAKLIQRMTGSEAWATLGPNPIAFWPQRSDASNRVEPLAKPQFSPTFQLERGERIFTVGSCFARNIEVYLDKLGFRLPTLEYTRSESTAKVDGFLNKYTPFSILNEFRWALDPGASFDFDRSFFEIRPGEWIDPQVMSNEGLDRERVAERRKAIIDVFRTVRECRVIVMTFGLVEAWWDNLTGVYLNRTVPKKTVEQAPDRYEFHVLDFDTLRDCAIELFGLLKRHGHPDLRVLLTVSPVPLTATFRPMDVMTANMYSKSVLRAVVEDVRHRFDFIDYFPSYESVMLSDRKLAWKDDLIHVKDEIVGLNVSRMIAAYAQSGVEHDDEYQFNMGLTYERQRHFADAEACFRKAWAANSQRHDAARHLGMALAQLDRLDEAEEWLNRALGLQPTDAVSLYHLALLHRRRNEPQAALERLRACLSLDRHNAGAHYQLALCLIDRNEPAEALGALDEAVRLSPDNDVFRYRRALLLAGAGRRAEALAEARQAVMLQPKRAAYRHLLCGMLLERGELREAAIEAETAARLEPGNAIYRKRLDAVRTRLESGKTAAASGDALLDLGKAHEKAGRLTEAEDCFRRALAPGPQQEALRHLGAVLARLDRLDEAEESLGKALALQPGDAQALYHLALVDRRRDRVGQAAERLRASLRINPVNPGGHYQLALCLSDMGEKQAALEAINEAIRFSPDFEVFRHRRAQILIALGRISEAVADAQFAVERAPRQGVYRHVLAGALFVLGRYREALAEQQVATELEPANAVYGERLARIMGALAGAASTSTGGEVAAAT